MPLTLDDAEKLLQAQATEINVMKDTLANLKTNLSAEEKAVMEKRISELQKQFDDLHAKYANSQTQDEIHHCFWCP
jgi:hypothetical protein